MSDNLLSMLPTIIIVHMCISVLTICSMMIGIYNYMKFRKNVGGDAFHITTLLQSLGWVITNAFSAYMYISML